MARPQPHPHYLPPDIKEIAARLGEEAKRFAGATVLICGGHGFFGRYYLGLFHYLNQHVLSKPCRLIVLDNHITSGTVDTGLAERDGYRFVAHDIIQPITLKEPLDYIIQMAGIASPYYYRKYPLETLEVATTGTKHLLHLARERRVKGFLFFSSSEIYGDPDPTYIPTPESYRGNVSCHGPRACYDESKRLGETLCTIFHEVHGVPTKIVRPFNVYGPGMREMDYRVIPNFASRIVGGKPLHVYSSGRQTRTFCYITDAIVGFTKVLLDGTRGQAYNIGNPVPEVPMLELAETFQRVMGRRLQVQRVEYPDSYPPDEPQRRCPDISKARVQLQYEPAVSLEDGLGRFMGWAAKHYVGSI